MALTMLDKAAEKKDKTPWSAELTAEFEREAKNPNPCVGSTLLSENLALAGIVRGEIGEQARALLFDPQTAGGLLAGIPPDRAAECVAALRSAGYADAAIIGHVRETGVAETAVGVSFAGIGDIGRDHF